MSAPTAPPTTGAVFLSYAHEDTDAARRITEALRGHGIEVWFDQSELRGGDAWDQKIKKQIKECVLFLPIISANTQARGEGYFRLEWKLAVERTHLMAEGIPFLAPIAIDHAHEHNALVPPEFMRVHWTRLKDGQPTPQFLDQIKHLVEAPRGAAARVGRVSDPPSENPSRERAGQRPALPQKSRRPLLLGAMAVLAVVAAAYFALRPAAVAPAPAGSSAPSPISQLPSPSRSPSANEKSLAVLPLENLSPDPENAFFTDGMHAEIISTLSQISDLKVVSRTSALAFKGSALPLADIAQKLGAAHVITGSVRRAGNTVRIQLELRRASDEALLWSLPKGDRDLKDVLGLQGEVADQVARVLQARTDKGSSAGARFLAAEPRVYDLYLKAHERYDANPSSRSRINECVAMLDEALRLDPKFMPAARLVGRLNVRLFLLTEEPAEKLRYATEARKWGEQSSRLMPGGAGDTALAFYYADVEGDYARSLRYAENAIHALPSDAEGYYFAGVALRFLGQPDEAVRRFLQAESLDVGGVPSWNQHIDALADLRRGPACEEIIAQYLRIKDQVVRFGSGAVAVARFKLDGVMPAATDLPAVASWLWRARRFEEMVTLCDARLAAGAVGTTRFSWLWRKADALARLKRSDDATAAAREALAVAEELKAAPKVGLQADDGRFAIAFARLGRADEAIAKARSQIEAVPAGSLGRRWAREIELAELYSLLNRRRECVEVLAKLLRVPSGLTVPMLKLDPTWDNMREDAGFKALLADPKNSAPF